MTTQLQQGKPVLPSRMRGVRGWHVPLYLLVQPVIRAQGDLPADLGWRPSHGRALILRWGDL